MNSLPAQKFTSKSKHQLVGGEVVLIIERGAKEDLNL
jgi:hypothetical protein